MNLVLGNNGIISKAKEAVKKTEEAQLKESLEMEMLESYIDSNSSDDIISMIDANKLKKMGVVGIKKLVINLMIKVEECLTIIIPNRI